MTLAPNSSLILSVYWTGLVMALWMTGVWRAFLRRKVWRAGASMTTRKVSAYQMALLAGGDARLALTAVVRLLGRKGLTAGIAGVLVPDKEFDETLDDVEREAMTAALKPALLRELLASVAARLKHSGITARLGEELAGMGYLLPRGSSAWWSIYMRNMLPFALLDGATCALVEALATPGEAWASLAPYGMLSIATMLVVAWPRRVTSLGAYIVWSAVQHHPDFKHARATQGEAIDAKTLSQSVALYGEDALAGSDMAWIPALLNARAGSSG